MNVKKLFTMTVLCAVIPALFAASMRDYVCVVRSNLPEKTVSFLKDYSDVIQKAGYKSYADQIDDYIENGTFGSGFTVRGSDGKLYVVTNRHVVEDAESVNLVFENEDGSYSEYKNMKIIASDEDIDIALIATPSGFNRKPLSLNRNTVNDGDEVWSAGFPALDNKPMWQFGKGSVTNSRARVEDLLSSEISTLIQHSAQVDSGNSGGPLLVSSSSEAGYSVVGINTWKVVGREGTNFAIPSKVVESFVENTLSGKNQAMPIDDRITQMMIALKDVDKEFLGMAKFVSNEMISLVGDEAFLTALRTSSGSTHESLIALYAWSPIDGMRYSIAYVVWKEFTKNGWPLNITVDKPEASGDGWTITMTPEGKKPVTTTWIMEQGRWKLSEFSTIQSKGTSIWNRSGHEGFDVADPFMIDIKGALLIPIGGASKVGFQLGADFHPNDFLYMSVGFLSETVMMRSSSYPYPLIPTKRNTIYTGA
ncbi:MAG: trypsin-like peptidase domain-containing protein, partial [Treponema sp.]|nr:trypsin-like peptidase domain-containing protein [Treponema sp.]